MDAQPDLQRLLEEIRDLQREHLAEYRRATARSLEVQERALARQEGLARTYRLALAGGAVVVAALLALLLYLVAPYL